MQLPKVLDDLGFERTRRAVAALALCLFVVLYAFLALMLDASWKPAFAGLAACYLVAFLGLAAEWFWGRWFASGLAWSGVMVSALSLAMMGWAWPLAIYGGLHALVVFLLIGKRMTALYDLQEAWRLRYKMDEHGVERLRKTVTRAAASLPSLILWALGPKEPGQGMVHALVLLGVSALGIVGLTGVIRLRTWGIVALSASALALLAHGGLHAGPEIGAGGMAAVPEWFQVFGVQVLGLYPGMVLLVTLLGTVVPGLLLASSVAPFFRPAVRYLRRR